jgi:hypothetical protein
MMKNFFPFLFLVFSISAFSQDIETRPYIKQDESISRLLQAHRQLNQNQRGIDGFRVQIYTDSGNRSKLRTDRMKAEFDNRYPDVKSYISYNEPYFKIRVGDFRTRLEAQRFLNQIASTYLFASIVVDRINFPELLPPPDKTLQKPIE